MTKFNPLNKDVLTYGEALSPIFEIFDPAEAAKYKEDYVAYTQKKLNEELNPSGLTALQVVNSNIGYWAGYGSNKDRARIEKLFNCAHPIFGSINENGIPTNEEAFACGKEGKTLNQIRNSQP